MNRKQYVEKHLRDLIKRKERLDKEIWEAYTTYVDDTTIHRLKAKKLKVRDEIEEIKNINSG